MSAHSASTIDAPADWQQYSVSIEDHQDDGAERDHILSPRPGLVLDQMYRYLWNRELQRRGILGVKAEEWKEQTGDLAVATDGSQVIFHRRQVQEFIVDHDAFYWLLSLGVLAEPPSNIKLYSFFTELTKAYFAAVMLSLYVKTGDLDSLRQRIVGCKPSFLDQLRQILSDITNQDVSDIL